MVALVTQFGRFVGGAQKSGSAAVDPDYGTIAWDPDDTEATELFLPTAPGDQPGPVFGTPAGARGTTFAVLGGAGRTDASGVTLGTDGTLTFNGLAPRPMVCMAAVTLSHADLSLTAVGQSLVTMTLGLHLYRNGALIQGASVYHDVTNLVDADQVSGGLLGYGLFALSAVVEFRVGDVAKLMVSNQSGNSPVTVVAGTFTMHSI